MCRSVGMAQTVCVLPRRGSRASIWPSRRGSQSSAQTCAAGAHCPLFGRPLACAGSGAARGRQPTRGLALASAIRRAGCRRPAARQDAQAWPRRTGQVVAKVMDLTCSNARPRRIGPAALWPTVGVGLRAVQRATLATHRLQPHRIRTFKRSNDPAFAEKKVEDIVGLYMDLPSTRWSSRSTRRAKSRRSTARNLARRSSPGKMRDDDP